MGIDGDGDGQATITIDADSVFSAANYLVASGATRGPDGVGRALLAYNHASWYVGDVLYYAHVYGGGVILGVTAHEPGLGSSERRNEQAECDCAVNGPAGS